MKSEFFEAKFSEYIDGFEYDEAESKLFSIIRMAFKAGWEAHEKEKED